MSSSSAPAGLTAARELRQRGRSVLILEARDRLGGRTWVDNRLGLDLEMGGTWIHWAQPHVWAEITRYGIEIAQSPVAEHAYWHAGGTTRQGSAEELFGLLNPGMVAMLADTRQYFDRPYEPFLTPELETLDQHTVLDRIATLNLPPEQDELVRGMWTLNFNGPPEVSGLTQALRWCSAASGSWQLLFEVCAAYKFKHGTRSLINAIAADGDADIRLKSLVTKVIQSPGGCLSVRTDAGEQYNATDVIVTLPLNALSTIEFEPGLSPLKQQAADTGQASRGVKTWIRFRGQVEPCYLFGGPDLPLTFAQTEYTVDGDTVFVAFGPEAARLQPDDVDGVAKALAVWRPDLVVVDATGHNWVADPLSRETWPMLRPGQLEQLRDLQQPDGHLHIAGSGFGTGWAGFMDGAIESGLRTARRIVTQS
ncbi:NAD(P)/FAD-dependent oxidoreductase [Nocardia vinacea]|uniref:flavin monoamine oxidase family protein n=1 Tax=Nocardia vinacea TaxID=96468 RepID=UPI003440F5AF